MNYYKKWADYHYIFTDGSLQQHLVGVATFDPSTHKTYYTKKNTKSLLHLQPKFMFKISYHKRISINSNFSTKYKHRLSFIKLPT